MAARKAKPGAKQRARKVADNKTKVEAKRRSTEAATSTRASATASASKRPRSRTRGAEPAPLKFAPTGELARHYQRVLDLALRFPGVEATRAYGTPCIKADGKIMARLRSEAEGGLALRCDFPERQMLMQADPRAFYVTEHYLNWPMVLVNLAEVRWDAMPGLIEAAWRLVAPARLVSEFDAGR
jgi:hypothetical protein